MPKEPSGRPGLVVSASAAFRYPTCSSVLPVSAIGSSAKKFDRSLFVLENFRYGVLTGEKIEATGNAIHFED